MKHKIKITPFTKVSSLIIKIGMPVIALVFFYILHTVTSATDNDRAWVFASAYSMLEYALMSFTLVFCGALLADISEKRER